MEGTVRPGGWEETV